MTMIDIQTMKDLVSLGYIARESGLEVEEIVEMVEKGFIAMDLGRISFA